MLSLQPLSAFQKKNFDITSQFNKLFPNDVFRKININIPIMFLDTDFANTTEEKPQVS